MFSEIGGWLTGEAVIEAVRRGDIIIDEFDESQINANSYNYRLSPILRRLTDEVIDCRLEDAFEEILIDDAGYLLRPGECYLGMTEELFGSNVFASLITGRSSVGRKFVTNHVCAGLIDQGFFGRITLEITVIKPTIVYPRMLFGQIFWFSVLGKSRLYRGKYQGQDTPTNSKLHLDWE
ncbi:dCTP deaminase [Rhodovulum sulfidophilum]|uniref:dCTP deaminase n=1 Tax=Rhodovulum sulfidophilum TaxID=35806 RepID=UPI001924BF2A|nr:hypothetical protein [Rhodovulum sulfidophilum]MBL3559445.1 hypothetical protein [Rhodovulum sulfidophilum]